MMHVGKAVPAYDENGAPVWITSAEPGWPDLFLAHEGKHLAVAMELKREQGEVSVEQWEWIRILNACGIPAMVIRPSDLREGRVNAILEGR